MIWGYPRAHGFEIQTGIVHEASFGRLMDLWRCVQAPLTDGWAMHKMESPVKAIALVLSDCFVSTHRNID
jgi:hypothetical protein